MEESPAVINHRDTIHHLYITYYIMLSKDAFSYLIDFKYEYLILKNSNFMLYKLHHEVVFINEAYLYDDTLGSYFAYYYCQLLNLIAFI